MTTLFNYGLEHLTARKKKILILTLLTFAALC
jgi:hypothetical protein